MKRWLLVKWGEGLMFLCGALDWIPWREEGSWVNCRWGCGLGIANKGAKIISRADPEYWDSK